MSIDIRLFKDFFEQPDVLFILHNAKFDLRFFYYYKIVIKNVYDTYLAEKLLWLGYSYVKTLVEGYEKYVIQRTGDPEKDIYGMTLDDCTQMYLDIKLDKSIRGVLHKEGLSERVVVYGCEDVRYLLEIREIQLKLLEEKDLLIALQIENEVVKWIAYMEFSGMKLDVVAWRNKMKKDQARLNAAKNQLDEWIINHGNSKFINYNEQGDLFGGFKGAECNINWNSSKQLIPLFESLGFDLIVIDSETGLSKKSVDSNIIKNQEHLSNIAPIYIEYSEAFKVVSTYGQSFIDAINPVTKRIHTQFTQIMNTTRMSSGGKDKDTGQDNINFQNIPSDVETRSCFVAEKGYSLVSCDYSGQEDRVFAEKSEEPNLISFYNETRKRDGHNYVAKLVYAEELKDVPEEEVKEKAKQLRDNSKVIKFRLHYGGDGAGADKALNLPVGTGKDFENKYFKAFPYIKDYFNRITAETWRIGYILISKYTRHKTFLPDWKTLRAFEAIKNSDGFWEKYAPHKQYYTKEVANKEWFGIPPQAKKNLIKDIFEQFASGADIETITSSSFEYIVTNKKFARVYRITPSQSCVYCECVKYYFKKKGDIDRMSKNFPIQGESSQMTKIALIRYCRHLERENLLFKVFIPAVVHDEIIVEAPDQIIESEASTLKRCMEEAGRIFCNKVPITAVAEVGKHWIH